MFNINGVRIVSLVAWAAVIASPASALAETAKIAAGEYAPFVSQQLPEDGVTAAIVTAAFKTQGVTAQYVYLPWKRGLVETGNGAFVGTFPYLKTPEREVQFLYSEPIFTDSFRLLALKTDAKTRDWKGAAICVPLGYDTTQIESFVASNTISIERPTEISHCIKMLNAGRVKAVWASELVGMGAAKNELGSKADIEALDIGFKVDTKYYFIVAKSLPNASKWAGQFNAGLKEIQKNGSYKKILERFSVQ